jgi:DNA-binding MarR family transcriptional regulator
VSTRFAAGYKARYAMTRPEWRALALLGARWPMTATEIGRQSGMHKTKVSRAVFALESRGWLTRSADAEDRRVEHLALTPDGRAAFGVLVAMAREAEAELGRVVGRDGLRALAEGLAALEAEMARDPGPEAHPALS